MRKRTALAVLVFSLLFGLSSLAAADLVIRRGIDVFSTPADGTTHYSFAEIPIPAGFFCEGSEAFAGRLAFKGLPLATEVPGQLSSGDTVVERLDDAVFDANGTAVTRLQFRALSLVSLAPLRTSCGAFHVHVSLGGPQRVTTMRIQRTHEGGGTFAAPLAVTARMTFVPVKPLKDKAARQLSLTGSFTFPPLPLSWGFTDDRKGAKTIHSGMVDTDGDLAPDTPLPGASNFFAGPLTPDKAGCGPPVCHTDPAGHQHCVLPPPPPYCLDEPIY